MKKLLVILLVMGIVFSFTSSFASDFDRHIHKSVQMMNETLPRSMEDGVILTKLKYKQDIRTLVYYVKLTDVNKNDFDSDTLNFMEEVTQDMVVEYFNNNKTIVNWVKRFNLKIVYHCEDSNGKYMYSILFNKYMIK